MSRLTYLNFKDKDKIRENFTIKGKIDTYNNNKILCIKCYKFCKENLVKLPFRSVENNYIENESIIKYDHLIHNGNFRDKNQEESYNQGINKLEKKGGLFYGLHTGFGKTYIASVITIKFAKMRTIILTHRKIISKQWIKTFETYTNAKICYIKDGNNFDTEAEIFICGITQVKKLTINFILTIGLLIIDEAREFCTQTRIDAIMRFLPKYIIGLSANIERLDRMHECLYKIFGKDIIYRISTKPFEVYQVLTEFKPDIRYTRKGYMDWNKIMISISENEERNKMIAKIANKLDKKKIMILCKHKIQVKSIEDNLKKICKRKIQTFMGNDEKFYDCDILISTISKSGIGFDQENSAENFDGKKFNIMILASNILQAEQVVGRLRCNHPIILDIIDEFSTFKKHAKIREEWYLSRNAQIKKEWIYSFIN